MTNLIADLCELTLLFRSDCKKNCHCNAGSVRYCAALSVTYLIWPTIGQILESFILTPRLVGERIGLHPLAVIFALLAFDQLFGFFGVLLALPASAILAAGLRALRGRYLASAFYGG